MSNNQLIDNSNTTALAWKNTLKAAIETVNQPVDIDDLSTLNSLPIFALILVINHASNTQNVESATTALTDEVIQQWVNQQADTPAGWQAVNVESFDTSNNIQLDKLLNSSDINQDRLSHVSVLRYVLCPDNSDMLTASNNSDNKITAIAHVIDEQLTKHVNKHTTEQGFKFDCHILPVAQLLKQHKVACFDMDSTLIEQEVIVEVAKVANIGDKVNEITESAMRGEIDFNESFAKRVGLLRGIQSKVLDNICQQLTLSAGAKTTITILNALGYHTVLISGGFTYFAKYIADTLKLDEYHANILDIDEDLVTGYVHTPILNGDRKAEIVQDIAKKLNLDVTDIICVGDGANDIPMMQTANLGLAYHAKPIVQARADIAINCTGLEGVLYALGYKGFH